MIEDHSIRHSIAKAKEEWNRLPMPVREAWERHGLKRRAEDFMCAFVVLLSDANNALSFAYALTERNQAVTDEILKLVRGAAVLMQDALAIGEIAEKNPQDGVVEMFRGGLVWRSRVARNLAVQALPSEPG